MTKEEVLDILGSPADTSLKDGLLKWYYYIEPGDPRSKKVFYFDEGLLTYKGEIIPPPLSAEEADGLKIPRPTATESAGDDFKRSVSDKNLRQLIKKELDKKAKKTSNKQKFEDI